MDVLFASYFWLELGSCSYLGASRLRHSISTEPDPLLPVRKRPVLRHLEVGYQSRLLRWQPTRDCINRNALETSERLETRMVYLRRTEEYRTEKPYTASFAVGVIPKTEICDEAAPRSPPRTCIPPKGPRAASRQSLEGSALQTRAYMS